MEVRGVKIGDRFIDTSHKKSKRISTVIDFAETRSLLNGKVLSISVIAQYEFMGQKMTINPPFTTVIRNKVS